MNYASEHDGSLLHGDDCTCLYCVFCLQAILQKLIKGATNGNV
jgi:hypothetical protein